MDKLNFRNQFNMPRDLVILALALFTWGVGEGMFIYFQPLYLQKWGANPVQIGMILSLVGIAMAVAQIPAGYLSDRIGSRPVMWSAWVLGLIATVLMALAGSLAMFATGLMLYSSTSFVNVPMNSYIASMRGKWSVERAITMVLVGINLGTVAGPALGGWIGQNLGLQTVYRIAAGIFLLSTLIVFLARRPADQEVHEASNEQPNLLTNPRFLSLLVMIFFTMFAIYLPQPLNAIYLQDQRGLSVQDIGQVGALGSLSNAVIMLALGSLRAPVGLLVGQGLVALFALLMWRGTSMPFFYLGYFFLGGYRLCRSMAVAYARTMVSTRQTGLAFGMIETGSAVSVIAAPAAAGFLYNRSPQLVYIASLIAIGIMLAVHTHQILAQRLLIQHPSAAAGEIENLQPNASQFE